MTATIPLKFQNQLIILQSRKANFLKLGQLIQSEGGTLTNRVDADADFFLDDSTKKVRHRVEALNANNGANITILDLEELYATLKPMPEEALALLSGTEEDHRRLERLLGLGRGMPRCHTHTKKLSIKLDNVDLSGVRLCGLPMRNFSFNGANFRGAHLESVGLPPVVGANFEGATFEKVNCSTFTKCNFSGAEFLKGCFSLKIEGCSFKGAKFRDMAFRNISLPQCDFSEASFAQTRFTSVTGSLVVRKARFVSSAITNCQWNGCDLGEADLSHAELQRSSFVNANLQGVDFQRADLATANLSKANLTGANLRGAYLADANLSGANLEKADFTGAYLRNCKTRSVNAEHAIGFREAVDSVPVASSNLLELEQKIKNGGNYFTTSALFDVEQVGTVRVQMTSYNRGNYLNVHATTPTRGNKRMNASNLQTAFLDLPARWQNAKLRVGSVKSNTLTTLVRATWCETFGIEVPTNKEIAAEQRAEQSEVLELLRSGPEGIKQWNARPSYVRDTVQNCAKQDLSQVDLSKAVLSRLVWSEGRFDGTKFCRAELKSAKFQGSSFQGADLEKAQSQYANYMRANFTNASLVQANLQGAILRDADFSNANLAGAVLLNSNLCGTDLRSADLTDANVQRASYDEQTMFPEGWQIPKGMRFVGLRLPPESVIGEHKGFRSFLKRLRDYAPTPRLTRAFRMLRFDRFQLFSELETDSIRGVVRGQGDASSVYSCYLEANGDYGCLAQSTRCCGGLQGRAMCKHLLVLLIGLAKAEQIELGKLEEWIRASKGKKHVMKRSRLCETFLKYKGAEAGEIDWRPVDTIPEDYYAS